MTQPVVRQYNVHDVGLEVAADDARLIECVEAVLCPFAVSCDAGDAQYRVTLRYGLPPATDMSGQQLLWQGKLFCEIDSMCYAAGRRLTILLPQRARVCLDLDRRQCEVIVRPDSVQYLPFCFVMQMLCEFLGEQNHHVMHAACLAVPGSQQHRAILLAGVSGAGKSTTSLALAHAGLPLLADDAAFLVQRNLAGEKTLRIWGLPRPCKVHRKTFEMLDWLKSVERRPIMDTDEFSVAMNRLPSGDSRWELAPGLVVLVGPRNLRQHQLRELSRLDAISELTHQNVRTMRGRVVERAGRSFEAFSQLVIASRVFHLSVGPDLDSLPPLLLALMET